MMDKSNLSFAKNHYENLMIDECKIYTVNKSKTDKGTSIKEPVLRAETKCHFRSINISKAVFAEKAGTKAVFMVCLPISTELYNTDVLEIKGKKYSVIGIRDASRLVQNIVEVILYE